MQNDYLDLFAEEGEEAREGFGGGVVGKEGDETGADDGAGGSTEERTRDKVESLTHVHSSPAGTSVPTV